LQELGITSDEALVLDNVPEGGTIVIVGAGYIAVEFAGALHCANCIHHIVQTAFIPLCKPHSND